MRDMCLDEGILQSFFDGELPPEAADSVAAHLASCAACAGRAREVEDEIAIMSVAFAPEMSLSVPTERLRERLDTAIAGLHLQTEHAATPYASGLRAWLAALAASFTFTPQRAIGFASLATVLAFAAIFAVTYLRPNTSGGGNIANDKVASLQPNTGGSVGPSDTTPPTETTEPEDRTSVNVALRKGGVQVHQVRHEVSRKRNPPLQPSSTDIGRPDASTKEIKLLPGERSYLQAIASLDSAINATGGKNALRPTLRVEYERNLAVVDQAIAATRAAARRDPRDPDASQFLLAAYQSKVDLLNTVAEQARLNDIQR